VFIALYGGTAAALWAALRCFPAPARRIFRTPGLWLLFIALVAGPSLFWPPMIGRNIPVAPAIHPRLLPVDNRVLAELTRVPEVGRPPPTLAFLPYSVPPDRLVANLQRLRAHTLRDCFPAYRFIPTNDWAAACQQDGLLASRAWLADHSLPGDFEVREEGPDFILAFRKPPQNP
jgi:hypothetical protein